MSGFPENHVSELYLISDTHLAISFAFSGGTSPAGMFPLPFTTIFAISS